MPFGLDSWFYKEPSHLSNCPRTIIIRVYSFLQRIGPNIWLGCQRLQWRFFPGGILVLRRSRLPRSVPSVSLTYVFTMVCLGTNRCTHKQLLTAHYPLQDDILARNTSVDLAGNDFGRQLSTHLELSHFLSSHIVKSPSLPLPFEPNCHT